MNWLIDASAWVIPVILAVTLHEAAHGYMARLFGDMTATRMSRVSMNPLRHMDKFGTLVLPGLLMLSHSPVLFGYAKPVPVDFNALKPRRLGMILVALAGPGINILLAFLASLLLHLEHWLSPEQHQWLFMNIYRMIMLNCVLAAFNLLPVLPLDGGRVLAGLLAPQWAAKHAKTEKYGMVLIFLILLFPFLMNAVHGPAWNPAYYLIQVPAQWIMDAVMHLAGIGTHGDGV